jgi:hypothetical protein
MIKEKRGIQWNRSQIRVSGRVGGSTEKKRLISEGYHCNQCEERNLVG